MENAARSSDTRVIATFTNHEDGVAAVVADIGTGLSVIVRDVDTGFAFPMAQLYSYADADKADAYARQIGGQDRGPNASTN